MKAGNSQYLGPLGRKQTADNNHFRFVWNNIQRFVSKDQVDRKIDAAVEEVLRTTSGKSVGFGWSGGKDSIALQHVMSCAGINRCVIGITHDLEYPEFLKWVTNNMPPELDVYDCGLTFEWLADNQDMLFPQTSAVAAKWFRLIQHNAQDWFYSKYDLDIIILGRRWLDSNYTGRGAKQKIYKNRKGVVRYSPIADWTHEEVMGVIHYYNYPLTCIYDWPNGWVVGTGCWPARQWTGSIQSAWKEIYIIDPQVVKKAATRIDSAKLFLNNL